MLLRQMVRKRNKTFNTTIKKLCIMKMKHLLGLVALFCVTLPQQLLAMLPIPMLPTTTMIQRATPIP